MVASPTALVTVPQAPCAVDPHETVQLAPAMAGSLVTTTLKVTCWEAWSVETGAGENAIASAGAMMVATTVLVADGSLVTAARMVTVFPTGTFDGAV